MNATTIPETASLTTTAAYPTEQLVQDPASLAGNASDRAPIAESQAPPASPAAPAPMGESARGFAITSFVLGICSVVSGWTFIAPIIGLVFGILALRRNTSERTLAVWGIALNAAMLVIFAVFALFFFSILGLSVVSGAFFA